MQLIPQNIILDNARKKYGVKMDEKVLTPVSTVEDPLVYVNKFSKQEYVHASLVSPEIFRLKAVWPFDLIPDELIIEEKRIIMKQKQLPYFVTTITIPIDRVYIFQVSRSIFFSSIYIKGDYTNSTEYVMNWVKNKDAHVAKEIVDGLKMKLSESIKINENNLSKRIQALQVLGSIY